MDIENRDKNLLNDLFWTAVNSAKPEKILKDFLPKKAPLRPIILAVGKAAASMAKVVEDTWGPCEGIALTRYGHGVACKGIEVIEAGHPFSDENSLTGTEKIISLINSLTKEDCVYCLISGGGSSLLCKPRKGIEFSEKQRIFSSLFKNSAPIREINTVRKHLSEIKGGQLSKFIFPAKVRSFIISDVPGDNPADIASGITAAETTSGLDALKILKKYHVSISDQILNILKAEPSVVPPNSKFLSKTENTVIASGTNSINHAKNYAESLGYNVKCIGSNLEGDAQSLGKELSEMAIDNQRSMRSDDNPILLLSGGECTVKVLGSGEGGPNAEFALSAAISLNGRPGISLIAGDTDGIDGKGTAAGAIVTPSTLKKASDINVDPRMYLQNSDSHSFFKLIDSQLITGPTLTNVNDFRAFVIRQLRN